MPTFLNEVNKISDRYIEEARNNNHVLNLIRKMYEFKN
jgi:hypothetical protein